MNARIARTSVGLGLASLILVVGCSTAQAGWQAEQKAFGARGEQRVIYTRDATTASHTPDTFVGTAADADAKWTRKMIYTVQTGPRVIYVREKL